MGPRAWLFHRLVNWLRAEVVPPSHLYSNFKRLGFAVEPGDVVLVEGRTRVSQVIKNVTQSSWTHSAIYIGRLVDIEDLELRESIEAHYDGDPTEQLLIESLLGEGTVVAPLNHYEGEHLRVCRPMGLSHTDQIGVIRFAASQLGVPYDVRQLLDLARFLLPYGLLPGRWRSTLFERNPGEATRHVCSSMMAEAYNAVNFPVLPFIERRPDGSMRLFKRNPRLFTPRDFDYSPYFDVLKFPYLDRGDIAAYRSLPWSETGIVYNDEKDFQARLKQSTAHVPELIAEDAVCEQETEDAPDHETVTEGDANGGNTAEENEREPQGKSRETETASQSDEQALDEQESDEQAPAEKVSDKRD